MSTKARYMKVRISNEDASKVRSLAGYKVVGDYVEGGDRTVLLERPEQPARPKATAKRKAKTSGQQYAANHPGKSREDFRQNDSTPGVEVVAS